MKRYKWSQQDAQEFSDFLLPMLEYDPRRRATAEQCLRHPWLQARQRPESAAVPAAASTNPGSPTAAGLDQQHGDSVEPAAADATTREMETPAGDTVVVMETDIDAPAETGKDDNVTPTTTPPTTVDDATV